MILLIEIYKDDVVTQQQITVDVDGLSMDERTTALETAIQQQYGDCDYYIIIGEA